MNTFNNLQLTQQPTPSRHRLRVPPANNDAGLVTQIAKSLKLNPLRLNLLNSALHCLRFADNICGYPSWILTDASGQTAVARRMDGKPYPPTGCLCERKVQYLPGANRAWPLGLIIPDGIIPQDAWIVLVVGPTEYLAALDVLACAKTPFHPIALIDESQPIEPLFQCLFRGRKVLIITPYGDPGLFTAQRWWRELAEFGATVEARQLAIRDLLYSVGRHGAPAVANMLNL